MKIVDAHIHIFSSVHGENARGRVNGLSFGQTENAGEIVQFIPSYFRDTAFPAEMLDAVMRENNICSAVLFQNPTIGNVNEEIGQLLITQPDRFAGMLQVDPFSGNALEQTRRLLDTYPFAGIKFELSTGWGWTGIHAEQGFHYDLLYPLIEEAAKADLVCAFDTGDTDSAAYLPEELDDLTDRFPQVVFVIEHGGYRTPGDDRNKWETMTEIARKPHVYLGICAIPSLLESVYPCKEAVSLLQELYNKVGAEKLLWGTDAPVTLKNYTYRQLIDWVRKESGFLTDAEIELILHGNAEKVYFKHNPDHGGI